MNGVMVQILIIDDDPAIRVLLQRTLTRSGYSILLADDGEQGLILARQSQPALIICDWLMPKMNGLEVCRCIKTTPELSTTFFILLTSLGSLEDRIKGLDAGADDFLCKPIELNELQARVRAGLRLHQLSHDLRTQKQILELELAEAADYVKSLLPEPLEEAALTIDFYFIPSRQLGGDGFDYFWLDAENLVIYLLDVAGHGLRAALPSLSVINLLRSKGLTQVDYYQPSQVLQGLNQIFQISSRNDKYFTIWYGVYTPKSGQLIYASAGHPPAVLIRQDSQGIVQETRLKTTGFPIGMFSEAEYIDDTCIVETPANLYLFSDGIYEIEQSDGKLWGLDKFIKLLKDNHYLPRNQLKSILQNIENMRTSHYLEDDVSLMQIIFKEIDP
jgi:sigma-B regulation protein RsbU (phosphoserine phosphatase)